MLPAGFRARARRGLWLEVEYFGDRYAEFRVQYASTASSAALGGLYQAAEQRWKPDLTGLRRFRRALFVLPDFDPERTENLGASFRVEFRREVLIAGLTASLTPPADAQAFPALAPLPELRKMPGPFYPINYLFIEMADAASSTPCTVPRRDSCARAAR